MNGAVESTMKISYLTWITQSLTNLYFLQMYNVRKKLKEARVGNRTWEDTCFRVPVVYVDPSKLLGTDDEKEKTG